MKGNIFLFIALLLSPLSTISVQAQTASTSDNLVISSTADRTITFDITDPGIKTPIIWGLDLAWLSSDNIQKGIAFMGKENVDIIRSSFTPTAALINGELPTKELNTLNQRINIINTWLGTDVDIVLNSDHPSVDPWFLEAPENWAALIDVTARHHEEAGHTVVTVSPFNEPDYGWGQGNRNDFYNIAKELKENPRFAEHFANIRISGGNTLSTDEALNWYNHLKDVLDEGNTHQLAGSFDSYANFYETVRANGHHATNDELHNVMEAMVGAEYGMQTGIWWGTAELARGEFVKASHGERLGYAEHRPNWSAASVYRTPEGKVQAFGGVSERQAKTTSYRFVSKDRNVFYDGYGPQREYVLEMPGGNGYQVDQSNAERVINITWGDDIQPVIDGRYVIVNRNSGMVIEVAGASSKEGANIRQSTHENDTHQQWQVRQVSSTIGGDFSHFTIRAVHSSHALDVLNWSLNNGANVLAYGITGGGNQHWYLEYAGDGWFYIRNRNSSKCLEVVNGSSIRLANIQQGEKDGGSHQQWRFLPIDAEIEFDAPSAPTGLVATGNPASIRLDWTASPETDVTGYTILRSESATGDYQTIARDMVGTSFVDNTITTGREYFYKIKAKDYSLNSSEYSNQVSAASSGKGLVAHLRFEQNILDSSANLNHAIASGEVSFANGIVDSNSLLLDGTNYLQLPYDLISHQSITMAMWIYCNNNSADGRILDFTNTENGYMFLTPRSRTKQLRFVIGKDGEEQMVEAEALPINQWAHLAITLSDNEVRIYVNSELAITKQNFTLNPMDLKPLFNYLGRSQSSDPSFNGYIDDFRIYNYALSIDEIAAISDPLSIEIEKGNNNDKNLSVWPIPARDILNIRYSTENNSPLKVALYNMNGISVINKNVEYPFETELDVSSLSSGMYILKLTGKDESLVRRILVKH